MIIDNKNNIILAYFNMNKIDYALYTIDDGIPEIYLSRVKYNSNDIDLLNIDKKESKNLKLIISEFLVNDHNYGFLKKIGYNSLERDQLKANKINKKGYQLIHLTNGQYDVFANNEKLKRIKRKKNNSLILVFGLIFLLIITLLILYILLR